MTAQELVDKRGWAIWSKMSECNWQTLILCPASEFSYIPQGWPLCTIHARKFNKGDKVSMDVSGGIYSFGVLVQEMTDVVFPTFIIKGPNRYRTIDAQPFEEET